MTPATGETLAQRLWAEHVRRVRSDAGRKGNLKRYAAKRDAEREKLILDHLGLVRKVARQVHRTMFHVPIEDLVQSGCLGLAEAAARYVPANGDFSHFCYFRVRGAMIDANRRNEYRESQHDSIDPPAEEDANPAREPREPSRDWDAEVSPAAALAQAQAGIFAEVWKLPRAHQRLIALIYQQDVRIDDASARLGLTPVEGRNLHRQALELLRPLAKRIAA